MFDEAVPGVGGLRTGGNVARLSGANEATDQQTEPPPAEHAALTGGPVPQEKSAP